VTTTQTDAGQTDAIRLESSHKRVRVLLAGELVADTTHAILVWENPYYPAYYIPGGDVRAELVPASDVSAEQISGRTGRALGEPEVLSVKVA
jgi:uncharacterized protein (DUF427 family)